MFCSIRLKACTGDGVDGLRGNAFIRSRKHTGQLFLHLRFAGAHGFNCHLEQPVKLPAQALCSYTDHIARAARSEFLSLNFSGGSITSNPLRFLRRAFSPQRR